MNIRKVATTAAQNTAANWPTAIVALCSLITLIITTCNSSTKIQDVERVQRYMHGDQINQQAKEAQP